MAKKEFTELSKARIQEKRSIVISEVFKDNISEGFTMAQQLEVEEDGRVTNIFLKNAFHISDIEGLYNLRDALNIAIQNAGRKKKEPEWD